MRALTILTVLSAAVLHAGCTSGSGPASTFGFAPNATAAAVPASATPRLPNARPGTSAVAREGQAPYEPLIARYAEENGVPLPLALAVVEKESGYNAAATGRGTIGLMQIKPATARGIGFKGTTEQLYDPETNLAWGMKYLGGAYRLGGGDICGTALRYQGGHRATKMTDSTRRYCADLKRRM